MGQKQGAELCGSQFTNYDTPLSVCKLKYGHSCFHYDEKTEAFWDKDGRRHHIQEVVEETE